MYQLSQELFALEVNVDWGISSQLFLRYSDPNTEMLNFYLP